MTADTCQIDRPWIGLDAGFDSVCARGTEHVVGSKSIISICCRIVVQIAICCGLVDLSKYCRFWRGLVLNLLMSVCRNTSTVYINQILQKIHKKVEAIETDSLSITRRPGHVNVRRIAYLTWSEGIRCCWWRWRLGERQAACSRTSAPPIQTTAETDTRSLSRWRYSLWREPLQRHIYYEM